MKRPTILAIILAGGSGSRLGVLTDQRSKPAMAFGGHYRLIDIPLSNLKHSHIPDVWIVEQYLPYSLNDHISNGRPWDLDRTSGGLRILPPYEGAEGEGFAEGNADALHRQAALIREFDPDLVLVLSADHLYRLDFRDVVDTHLAAEAALTMVTTTVDGDASRYGVVEAEHGRVTGFDYKPERPGSNLVAAEIFLYDADALLEAMDRLAEAEGGLKDYGDSLIPHFVEQQTVAEHRLEGYWRDVGTIRSYWEAHMELLTDDGFDLHDAGWPILTASPQLMPARVAAGARIEDSLVSAGATVRGTVVRSVIGPGAVVEAGAYVAESVLLQDAKARSGAKLVRAVADASSEAGAGAMAGASDGDITVLGSGACVPGNQKIPAGSELDPEAP